MKKILCTIVVLNFVIAAHAQVPNTFDAWFEYRLEKLLVDINTNDPKRQREGPSADSNGTSLVDRSSASDFLSMALSLRPQSDADPQGASAPAGTITVTAYSLLAFASRKSLTDPEFYRHHRDSRRLYITVGRTQSNPDEDGTDKDATVLGAKYLLRNDRDLFSAKSERRLTSLQALVSSTAPERATIKASLQDFLLSLLNSPVDATSLARFSDDQFPALLAALNSLSGSDQAIDNFLQDRLAVFQRLRDGIEKTAADISNGVQISIAYTAKLRKDPGYHNHQVAFIYDQPLTNRITWIVNAVGDYTDRRTVEDSRGGHVSTEFLAQVSGPSNQVWGRTPMTLSFSGDAKWATVMKPIYTFQAKLTVPLGTGIDLPIVYRYANRTVASESSSAEARFGLSIDTGRLAQLFR